MSRQGASPTTASDSPRDVKLFVSAVTDEFEPQPSGSSVTYRSRLRQLFQRPNVTVKDQEEIKDHAAGRPTLEKLDDYIRSCDAVVHLVGDLTGSLAKEEDVNLLLKRYSLERWPNALQELLRSGDAQFSYTQWEAYLAVLHDKVLIIAQAAETAPRGQTLPHDDPQREVQQAHVARLRALRRHVEVTFVSADELVAKVVTGALLDLLAKAHALPTAKPNNIPFATLGSLFKGREEFLEQVRSKLQRGQHVSAIVGTQAVHGLGGLGKTRAAVEYALRHADEYSALLFVAADKPESLQKSLAELCGPLVLNLPEQDVPEQAVRYAAAVKWLQKNPGWFLLLDNVDDEAAAASVEGLLPHLQAGHVVITSRFGEWGGGVERLDLDVLTPGTSIEFLLERTNSGRRIEPADATAVAELARELDGLPLALEQAAAFIVAKKESFAGYLTRWKAHEQKVRTWHDPVRMKYPRSIAITWDTSFEQLTPASRALLNMLSWFAPDPIPVALWKTQGAELLIAASSRRVNSQPSQEDAEDARAGLSRYGLVMWEPTRSAFRVHRLVQDVTNERLGVDFKASLTMALLVVSSYLPTDPQPSDVRSWPRWDPMNVHAAMLVAHADKHGIAHPTSLIMLLLGTYLHHKGLHGKAELLIRRSLEINEYLYGTDHPKVVPALNDLAQLLHATNRLVEAEPFMRRALLIDEQFYGSNHSNVAIRLNNLAQLLRTLNRIVEAEQLARRALAIDEQFFGGQHICVARDLSNLAIILRENGYFAEAEPLVRRALIISEHTYGSEHPEVARSLDGLAKLLLTTNRFLEAKPLLLRALAINEQSYGANHSIVAISLTNLSQVLLAENRLADAECLLRRARLIHENSYGLRHPDAAAVLNNLAAVLSRMKRVTEAEELLIEVVEIYEESYGEHHPNVVIAINNLAQHFQATNRSAEAEVLMRRAIAICENSLGPDHPTVAPVLNNLALLLQASNRLVEAEPLMRRHLVILRDFARQTRYEHKHLKAGVANYARLLSATGMPEKDVETALNDLLHEA